MDLVVLATGSGGGRRRLGGQRPPGRALRTRLIPRPSTGNKDSLSTGSVVESRGSMDDAAPDYHDEPHDEYEPVPRRSAPSSPSKGRVPPHNLSAEESLLGAMLLSRTAIDVASESVAP